MHVPKAQSPPATVPADRGPRHPVHNLVLVVATAGGIFLCGRMAMPFLPALAWAMALAVLLAPVQRGLEAKWRRPGLAAGVSVALSALVVLVAATFVGQTLLVQASKGASLIESKVTSGEWHSIFAAHPRLARLAEEMADQIDLPGAVKASSAWLSTTAGSVVKGSAYQIIGFCLTFYLLFFFLRDRRAVLDSLRSLAPLAEAEFNQLATRVGDTIYATLYGTLAVSAVQGLLGGLMFWWLGLPTPLLWGVVMALLAVVPVLGTFIVWLPAALYLAAAGSWGNAIILTAWGMLIVGTIDNLLRPILVGQRLKLHTVLVFISVVGGLLLFGPAGLILGPVALTVTTELLEVWSTRGGNPLGRVPAEDKS